MKIVVAIDSFKGCLSSTEAGSAAKEGILCCNKNNDVEVFAVADGGEGTVDAICSGKAYSEIRCDICDALLRKHKCSYCVFDDEQCAFIESASAIGLAMLNDTELSPMNASSFGLGEMIAHAIHSGCRDLVIGLGGTATNDCGIGMLRALGYDFLDKNGNSVFVGAVGVGAIECIDTSKVMPELAECNFTVLTDVKNPLYGENGCSMVFSIQKGATQDEARAMDQYITHFSEKMRSFYPDSSPQAEGAGAAGGLGYAFITFLGAKLVSGAQYIIESNHLEDVISQADLIITGEGRIDFQTSMGKLPYMIAKLAHKHDKPVIALCGCAENNMNDDFDAVFPVLSSPMTLEKAMEPRTAADNIRFTAYQIVKFFSKVRK